MVIERISMIQEVLHIPTLVRSNDMKLRIPIPHEPPRLCAKLWLMTTR